MRLDESTVLLIEDNPADAGLIQETAGYTVLMADTLLSTGKLLGHDRLP